MKKKSIALLVALVLLVGVTAGGTLAWLTDKTDPVVNTFTTADVDITLTETTGTSYKMVPGCDINKDPLVTVKGGSEKCWLFVKVERSENFNNFMTFDMKSDWTALEGANDVYYQLVDSSTADQSFQVIKNNEVTVLTQVTKAQMSALNETDFPSLTVTAYACQWVKNNDNNFTAAEAWAQVKDLA